MPKTPPAAAPTGPALYARLGLLSRIADKNALSVNYRALALTAAHARAAAPWGAMRCRADFTLDVPEACVDATDFLGLLQTAPPAPFNAGVRGTALIWECGPAHGHLALVDAQVAEPQGDPVAVLDPDFGLGLELAALACGTSPVAARAAGLEGVQIVNRGDYAYAAAGDGVVFSQCCLGAALPLAAGQTVTLKAASVALLATAVQRETAAATAPEMFVGVDDTSLYALLPATDTEVQIYQLAALPHDLDARLAPYQAEEQVMPLLRETVVAFVRRAEMLAENRAQALVEVAVTDGRTTLAFREPTGAFEEFYEVVGGGPRVTAPPVRLEARRLARALAHADRVVFDYAARDNLLFLRGDNGFMFGVAGRSR